MSARSGELGGGRRGTTPGVAVKFVSAGLAGCVAETATIPIDTAKVRLQVSTTHTYSHSRGRPSQAGVLSKRLTGLRQRSLQRL